MKIHFLGAARTVTGSMHILETEGTRILLDCGMFQGDRVKAEEINKSFPFDVNTIDYMVLSHSHIDHSGLVPRLVSQGFGKNIYMTAATKDLAEIMLRDSARIQEMNEDTPLYTSDNVENSFQYFVPQEYDVPFKINDKITVTFRDAGHILGSAITEFRIKEGGAVKTFVFTGDLGRKNTPIIRDPYQIQQADALVMESTYGNKLHSPAGQVLSVLEEIVKKTVARKGKIIIPAFSVGRTQEIIVHLHQLADSKRIPAIPVFVDSPLSVNVTNIYKSHTECYDDEIKQVFERDEDPFGFAKLNYITDIEDSKRLNTYNLPCIIISASGMCESGRIKHHLKNNIENPNNTILIIGYQAENTIGRQIVEKVKKIRLFDGFYSLNAEVRVMNEFSAHADKNELLGYVKPIKDKINKVFLVHGE